MADRQTDVLEKEPVTDPAMTWIADVRLLTNPVILRATALAFGLAYLLIVVVFAAILGWEGDLDRLPMFMAAMLVGFASAAVLVVLVMLLIFQNRMRCRFHLDDAGFGSCVVDRRAEIGAILAVTTGAGAGNPTLAGAGLAGLSARREYTSWDNVAAVQFRPRTHSIVMKAAGWWPIGALHCNEQSYAPVADRVRHIAMSRGLDMMER
jgi:hypothetical protein